MKGNGHGAGWSAPDQGNGHGGHASNDGENRSYANHLPNSVGASSTAPPNKKSDVEEIREISKGDEDKEFVMLGLRNDQKVTMVNAKRLLDADGAEYQYALEWRPIFEDTCKVEGTPYSQFFDYNRHGMVIEAYKVYLGDPTTAYPTLQFDRCPGQSKWKDTIEIDFRTMIQKNKETGQQRPIGFLCGRVWAMKGMKDDHGYYPDWFNNRRARWDREEKLLFQFQDDHPRGWKFMMPSEQKQLLSAWGKQEDDEVEIEHHWYSPKSKTNHTVKMLINFEEWTQKNMNSNTVRELRLYEIDKMIWDGDYTDQVQK